MNEFTHDELIVELKVTTIVHCVHYKDESEPQANKKENNVDDYQHIRLKYSMHYHKF